MENQNIIETRFATELQANTETGIITGRAIIFNQESNLLGGQFTEKILPQAATQDFLESQDIVMRYQHQPDSILARYRKDGLRNSLSFNVDERGVNFSFKAKAKDAGLVESIASGDINGASFGFRVSPEAGAENWEKRSDGTYLRTISKFDVVKDFSIVIEPAYAQASVSTRGLTELQQKEEADKLIKDKEAQEAQKKIEEQKKAEALKLQDYYKKYEDVLSARKK